MVARSLAELQLHALREVRAMIEDTKTEARELLETIFNPATVGEPSAEIDRMMNQLFAEESGAAGIAAPAADSAVTPSRSTLDEAIESTDRAPSSNLAAARSPADGSALADPTPVPGLVPERETTPTHDEARPELLDDINHEESTEVATVVPRRTLGATLAGIILPPLQSLSAPMTFVPKRHRPLLSAMALTLPIWIPCVWWLSREVAAAQRVRPLEVAELQELTASLRCSAPPASSDQQDEKSQHGKAQDAGHGESKNAAPKSASPGGH